jgi:hypothetical protein
VEAYIDHLPSIAAALLAEIIQKVLANLQEGNIDESVAFILKLVGLHQYFSFNEVMRENYAII